MTSTRFALVMPNFNGVEHLKYSIPSIFSTAVKNFTLFVVDNSSTDSSMEFLSSFPDIRVIQLFRNVGWAAANNVVLNEIIKLDYTHVIFINNDVLVPEFWLNELDYIFTHHMYVRVLNFAVLGISHHVDKSDYFKKVEGYSFGLSAMEVSQLFGMCFCVDLDLIKSVGPFDDRFFLYKDEDDYSLRLLNFVDDFYICTIPIWHHVAGSATANQLFYSYHQYKSNMLFDIKHNNIVFGLRNVFRSWLNFFRIQNNDSKGFHGRMKPNVNAIIFTMMLLRASLSGIFIGYTKQSPKMFKDVLSKSGRHW